MTNAQNDPFSIDAQEFGTVRVFSMPFDDQTTSMPTAKELGQLLGDISLRADKVEVVKAGAIEGLGLTGYLREGYGVTDEDLSKHRKELSEVDGVLVFLPASAFGGLAQSLRPAQPLRFLGVFREERAAPPKMMARTDAAKGTVAIPDTQPVETGASARSPTWLIALGALLLAAVLVLFAVM